MIIMGLDPGTATTGYGVIEQNNRRECTMLGYGVLRTPAKIPLPERLHQIAAQLTALIQKYQPNLAACEKLYFSRNVTTALDVGQARGVLLLILEQYHIPIRELTPLQVKQATTGYGRADKQQMQYMVQKIVHLATTPKPDDAADALAIALAVTL